MTTKQVEKAGKEEMQSNHMLEQMKLQGILSIRISPTAIVCRISMKGIKYRVVALD